MAGELYISRLPCLMLAGDLRGSSWKICLLRPTQQPQPAKADLPFIVEVRVFGCTHRAQLKARDLAWLSLAFQHAGQPWSCRLPPFPSRIPRRDVWLSRLPAGMLACARAGKWTDQGWAQRTTGLALALLTISWLPIGYARHLSALADKLASLRWTLRYRPFMSPARA